MENKRKYFLSEMFHNMVWSICHNNYSTQFIVAQTLSLTKTIEKRICCV